MSDKDDGGEAFPRFIPDGHYNGSIDVPGMSLRDYFAAMAMQGVLAGADENQTFDVTDVANISYDYADAMLKARQS